MKIPEFFIFAKSFVVGFLIAEVFRSAFYLGENSDLAGAETAGYMLVVKNGVMLLAVLICFAYAFMRSAHITALKMLRSYRVDLLIAILVGIWANQLASTWLSRSHMLLKAADANWATMVLVFLCSMLLSTIVQQCWVRSRKNYSQLYFIADEEVSSAKEDLLASEAQAESFAKTVLASGAHPGLVFGVDGPWGVGKTSFVNLAERYWEKAADRVIVCRFEPLRYASESDLSDRLIRDLSAAIQRRVFAPEFRSAASRYSRLIKGKADISFLGFKLSVEPSQETVDDLLDDIDEVLRRIGRRVIIVIDDLDRLDSKTINNVLFATKRTFRLSQAAYVLCYDTEVLVGSSEEGRRAREFLEKFVTIKLSLFVDSSKICNFLRRDWQCAELQYSPIPSDTMVKLGAVLNELADILEGEQGAKYLPLVGDFRKIKRFVNSMIAMQLEKSDLGRTDFDKGDLIRLILLHLNFPGLFRRVYAEETEGRSGFFSVNRDYGARGLYNSESFLELMQEQKEEAARFLLTQLFDVETLGLGDPQHLAEEVLRSRACFNSDEFRNLEGYLKLIVRCVMPEPQETFILYQSAVEKVRKGMDVDSVLMSKDFLSASAHDQFWRILISQSRNFTHAVAEDAIDTLIEYLPRYSMTAINDRGLRPRSIYSLLLLLDRAGWGRTSGSRLPNSPENIVEIAWRIFGENSHQGKGIIKRLVSSDRGALGWHDLMLFRLHCSADRGGQLYNLHSALIVDQDSGASTTGLVSNLALLGMRKLSQEIFSLFKKEYVVPQRNFLVEVNNVPDEAFLGLAFSQLGEVNENRNRVSLRDDEIISAARSSVKSFVIYQLSNQLPPNGVGVGCGYYDEYGSKDNREIARQINDYVFNCCFNPNVDKDNTVLFLDYCLSNLTRSLFSEENGAIDYVATKGDVPGGLDPRAMGYYWKQHQNVIRQRALVLSERSVITSNYIATYGEDLPEVYTVLDELAKD
ncbi:KAP P-loop protein [Halomonas daqingensis]|uniref:KAP P-loop protein n=1 Tax=Billgrantia desiderata TaxID=52021 RepID=A0ABS9B9D9_9GAMM|nr:KAP family NTPase [Halomonas desiderata]MCE8043933.1 KAP P-loop protein [Halomonas desiderata]MCE8048507.1 KAP P-loop protein [Halomonas desiderata]